ncbi:hypothetical protein [Halomarina oriensis]|uniref:Uncharacterized protein n=1 Tax=Halomarina oriensis TaxID=671145 RepID=A0A6B0GKB8_9EURY|nr:hypothetical protein [Halomarina oriensis]MWG33233.1 hypothetical protein [Halomarina oriensis]
MSSIGRRRLLAASVSGFASLAGCSALRDEETEFSHEPYRIGEVALNNHDSIAHEADLLIRRDDEVVHWQSYELPPRDPGTDGSWERIPAATFDGCTPGVYRLAVRVDGEERRVFPTVSDRSHDGNSRVVRLHGDGEFDYLAGAKRQFCSSPTATTE